MSYVQRGEILQPGRDLKFIACHRVGNLPLTEHWEIWHTEEGAYILLGPDGDISLIEDVVALLRLYGMPEDNLGPVSVVILDVNEFAKQYPNIVDLLNNLFGEGG